MTETMTETMKVIAQNLLLPNSGLHELMLMLLTLCMLQDKDFDIYKSSLEARRPTFIKQGIGKSLISHGSIRLKSRWSLLVDCVYNFNDKWR